MPELRYIEFYLDVNCAQEMTVAGLKEFDPYCAPSMPPPPPSPPPLLPSPPSPPPPCSAEADVPVDVGLISGTGDTIPNTVMGSGFYTFKSYAASNITFSQPVNLASFSAAGEQTNTQPSNFVCDVIHVSIYGEGGALLLSLIHI